MVALKVSSPTAGAAQSMEMDEARASQAPEASGRSGGDTEMAMDEARVSRCGIFICLRI
jgi:hypothetical protein